MEYEICEDGASKALLTIRTTDRCAGNLLKESTVNIGAALAPIKYENAIHILFHKHLIVKCHHVLVVEIKRKTNELVRKEFILAFGVKGKNPYGSSEV